MDSITHIQNLISNELNEFELLLKNYAVSNQKLANTVIDHIIGDNAKRIRPILVILSYLSNSGLSSDNKHIKVACIIEFLHTASLLHDDVIDNAELRRHKKTAHSIWGNNASILTGDLLHAKAFHIITSLNDHTIQKIISKTTQEVIEGELLQLSLNRNIHMRKIDYYSIISAKTAKLFTLSSHLGAVIATNDSYRHQAMQEYGHHLGILFQIIDDILDYKTHNNKSGKQTGIDIQEGKITLPLIICYEKSTSDDKKIIEKLVKNENTTMQELTPFIEKTKAIELSLEEAKLSANLAKECLEKLPKNLYKKALSQLVDFAMHRAH